MARQQLYDEFHRLLKPMSMIVNSKQQMLAEFVDRLRNEDKVDLQYCLEHQTDICRYITEQEFFAKYNDGNWCYVLIIDYLNVCHAIIGRQIDDDYDGGDDMPTERTVVVDTLGPTTVKQCIKHASKFQRQLLLIDMSSMHYIKDSKLRWHSDYVDCMFDIAKWHRQELVQQIKLIKCVVAVCDKTAYIDALQTTQQFEAALTACAVALCAELQNHFKITAELESLKLMECANEAPALFVEFRMPCIVNGKLNAWSSCTPLTTNCRYIAYRDRPLFMLKRSILAMLNPLSYNIDDRMLQYNMQNMALNLINKRNTKLMQFIPEQHRNAICV